MSRSVLYVANTDTQAVAVGGTLGLGNTIRRFGCASALSSTNIVNLDETGYYDVNVSVVAAPTAAGTVTVSLLNNGVAIPGATASATVAAAGESVNLSFESVARVFCNANTGALSIVLEGAASDVTNVAIVVRKL